MRILSWNVNGLRSSIEKGFNDIIKDKSADIVCIQETKIASKMKNFEIDDRDYTNEELRQCQNQVIEYIMSHSKNEISNVKSKFENVLKKINV